ENINEPLYEPPMQTGEETKAIPIITDDMTDNPHVDDSNETTIVHQGEATAPIPTQTIPPVTEKQGKNKQKKKRKKRWGLIFGIASVMAIALIFLLILLFSSPKDVVIPDVIDLEYEEAVKELEAKNLKVNKETMYSEEIEEGKVVKTDPEAGRTVKEKSVVDVYVSEGKEKVVFEDYVGKNFSQVKRILDKEGYEEVRSYDVVSDEPV